MPLVGYGGLGGNDRVFRVSLIGAPYIARAGHGDAVVVAGASLRAHEIVPAVAPGQVRGFDAAPVGAAPPDGFGVSHNRLFFRRILHQADHAGLFVVDPGFPLEGYQILAPVLVVQHRGVKPGGVQIHRLRPGTPQIGGGDQEIVHVKIAGVHRVHDPVNQVEPVLGFAVGQAGSPDPLGAGQLFQIHLFVVGEDVGVEFPVFQIPGMVHGYAGEPLKGGHGQIVVIALAAEAGIRVEAGQNRILNHNSLSLQVYFTPMPPRRKARPERALDLHGGGISGCPSSGRRPDRSPRFRSVYPDRTAACRRWRCRRRWP